MQDISCHTCLNNIDGMGCRISHYEVRNPDYCLMHGEPTRDVDGFCNPQQTQFTYSLWKNPYAKKKQILDLDDTDFFI